jgi:hypothetical protein
MRKIDPNSITASDFSYKCDNCGFVRIIEFKGLRILSNMISLGRCPNCEKNHTFIAESDSPTALAKAIKKIFSVVRLLKGS